MGLMNAFRSIFRKVEEHVYYSEEYDAIIIAETKPELVSNEGPLVYLGPL